MLFHLLKLPLKRLLQNSVAPIMSIMIIDGRRYRYSKCDIGSSFTHFHPAPLWRHRASLSISVDCDWLEGILVLLPFSRAPLRPACLQASFWNWLMDWLWEWQDQCSRTTSSRDQPRSHMTPYMSQYVPLSTITVDSQHSSKNSGKKCMCITGSCVKIKHPRSFDMCPSLCGHNGIKDEVWIGVIQYFQRN